MIICRVGDAENMRNVKSLVARVRICDIGIVLGRQRHIPVHRCSSTGTASGTCHWQPGPSPSHDSECQCNLNLNLKAVKFSATGTGTYYSGSA